MCANQRSSILCAFDLPDRSNTGGSVKQYLFVVFFFSSSITCIPLNYIKKYFAQNYCFRTSSSEIALWTCAYYLAFKKDIFDRKQVHHHAPRCHVQKELWRDVFVAVEKMLPLRLQLDTIREKYQYDWSLSKDCFDEFNEKKIHERQTYLPCVRLVNEFRKAVKSKNFDRKV